MASDSESSTDYSLNGSIRSLPIFEILPPARTELIAFSRGPIDPLSDFPNRYALLPLWLSPDEGTQRLSKLIHRNQETLTGVSDISHQLEFTS